MATPNHNYDQPAPGSLDGTWGTTLNNIREQIDLDITVVDTDANITTTNYTTNGQLAFAYDTGTFYYGNAAGPSWDAIGTVGVSDFEALDDVSSGTLANRPVAGTAGNWYFTTDSNGVYYDDGTAWQTIAEIDTDTQLDWPTQLIDSPNGTIPIVYLDATESYELPVRVPAGETLTVYRWGAFLMADGTAPLGLEAQLLDGADTVQVSANTVDTENTAGVASYTNSGAATATFKLRVYNGTGTAYTTDGVGSPGFAYEVA